MFMYFRINTNGNFLLISNNKQIIYIIFLFTYFDIRYSIELVKIDFKNMILKIKRLR